MAVNRGFAGELAERGAGFPPAFRRELRASGPWASSARHPPADAAANLKEGEAKGLAQRGSPGQIVIPLDLV